MCMTQEASMDLMICIIVIQWGAFRQESSTMALGVCVRAQDNCCLHTAYCRNYNHYHDV